MTNSNFLRGSVALRALALLGAGIPASMMLAVPAAAQDFTNVTASGQVTDAAGNGIPGATVTIRSNNQGFERSVTTDSSGGYRIPQLPSGVYTFTITGPDGATFTDPTVEIGQDQAANTFELGTAVAGAAADASGDIVVTGRRVRSVDFERTTTGAVIELGELATRVPVARDITSVVLLAPGTTQGDSAFGNLPNIRGASVAENAYFINGLNITQFRQGLGSVPVPFDFYNTVDIKTGGFPAEFGRATGGIVNAVTKSGGNEFHGGVLFNWEPDELQEDAPNTLFADNDGDFSSRTDAIFQLSGPVFKDRLFFYGIYNARDVISENAGTSAAGTVGNFVLTGSNFIRDRNKSPFFGGKVDFLPFDGHRLEATYFDTSSVTNRTIFGTGVRGGVRYNPITNAPGDFASQAVFRAGGENYVGRYTGSFTDWLTVSAAYGKNKQRQTTESTTPDLSSIVNALPGAGNQQLGNTTANATLNFDEREFYRADADIFVNLFGSHHFRFGYDREDLTSNSATQANGGFQLTILQATAATQTSLGIPVGTQFVRSRFFLNGGEFTSRNEAYYLQDSWQLFDNRLTLQLGVRNDRFVNRNADREAFYKSGNQWAPRVGFAFDPFGANRTKVYGSYGRYFLPVAGNTNIRLAGSELDYDRYNVFGGFSGGAPVIGAPIPITSASPCPDTGGLNCRIRSDGQPTPTISTVAQNLKPQSIDEYILGAEHRFDNRIRVGLFYTRSRLNEALEDAAIDPAVRAFCASINNTQCANIATSAFNGTHQYVLINPGRNAIVTLSDILPGETQVRTIELSAEDLRYPQAERKYDAATLQIEREFDGVWSLAGSYTYSKLRGNYEGGVKSDNGQTDTGLTTDFDLPGLALGTFGPSPNDRRHNFKLYGSYQVTPWFSVGGNFSATSQRRFGCLGTVNPDIDQDAFDFYGASGFFCNLDASGNVIVDPAAPVTTANLQLTPRGSQFKSDWLTNSNLDFAFRVPTDAFNAVLRVSVLNVFNEQAKLDFNEVGTSGSGTPNATYRQVTVYQSPRSFRLQFGVNF